MISKLLECFSESDEKSSVLSRVLNQSAMHLESLVAFCWIHPQWYLPDEPPLRLLALVGRDPDTGTVKVVITDKVSLAEEWLANQNELSDTAKKVEHNISISLPLFAEHLDAPIIVLDGPIPLVPVVIPKPWGREIWYTGIEERGQSRIGNQEYSIPLPWLLSLTGDSLLGAGSRELILLKVLDPLVEPVYGDLYFELHEEKQEVYVVVHVDESAWPAGQGTIRYGFNPEVQVEYEGDEGFRKAYGDSVRRYEEVRRKVDRYYDTYRGDEGIGADELIPVSKLKQWREALPKALLADEGEARLEMDRFTQLMPLSPGDVVKVPCLLPHALQHGVRTVEFQTPVYERKILSFAQKVLTQEHWDTDEAIELMSTDAPVSPQLEVLESSEYWCRESIVEFDDFSVERVTLTANARWTLQVVDCYALVMVVAGPVMMGGSLFQSEDSALIPVGNAGVELSASGDQPAIVLVSRPVT